MGGRVIGVRLDPKGLQLLTIDRGTGEGVQRLMPVVVGEGVVGRIHAVASGSADVLVLTDRNSSIAVRVDRTRARANVRGTGVPDACRLEYALRSDEMQEGDVLVTSGTDGVFPRGLPVGKLAGVKRGGQGLYQRAEVEPAVDVTSLDEVLVLTDVGHDADVPPEVAVEEPGRPLPSMKAAAPAATAARPAPAASEVRHAAPSPVPAPKTALQPASSPRATAAPRPRPASATRPPQSAAPPSAPATAPPPQWPAAPRPSPGVKASPVPDAPPPGAEARAPRRREASP